MNSIPDFRLVVKRYELNVGLASILDINLQPVTQLEKEITEKQAIKLSVNTEFYFDQKTVVAK